MYCNALSDGRSPDAETLSADVLPTAVATIQANQNQSWFIKHGNEFQRSIESRHLHSALMNIFSSSKYTMTGLCYVLN